MKYIIMFFCIVFCVIGDAALWVVEKMTELVSYGSRKVLELERSEHRGAHEKGRLPLICVEKRDAVDTDPCQWPEASFPPYDWAKEECGNEA